MILIIDTETTGLPKNMETPYTDTANWPHMLSVAWEQYRDDGALVRKNAYIVAPRTGVVNSPQAMAVNGITESMQEKEGFSIEYILIILKLAMESSTTIVAHNVPFDRGVIGAEFRRSKMVMPQKNWVCTKEDVGNLLQLPPTEAQRKYRPEIDYKQPRLDELYQFLFGKPVPGREVSHGAKQDAEACAKCYWELKKRQVL